MNRFPLFSNSTLVFGSKSSFLGSTFLSCCRPCEIVYWTKKKCVPSFTMTQSRGSTESWEWQRSLDIVVLSKVRPKFLKMNWDLVHEKKHRIWTKWFQQSQKRPSIWNILRFSIGFLYGMRIRKTQFNFVLPLRTWFDPRLWCDGWLTLSTSLKFSFNYTPKPRASWQQKPH